MSSSHITYTQSPDTTPEHERAVLAQIYRFILTRSKAKAAGTSGSEDDRKIGVNDDDPATDILPH